MAIATVILIGASHTLYLIDVNNPASPALIGSISTGSGGPFGEESLWVDDAHTAFFLDDNEPDLDVFDISNSAAPALVSSLASVNQAGQGQLKMARHGDFLLVLRPDTVTSQKNILEVYDVSDLSSVSSVATYNLSTGFATAQKNPTAMKVHGDALVVTSDGNAASPPARLGFYDLSALPTITQTTVTTLETGTGSGMTCELIDVDTPGEIAYVALSDNANTVIYLKVYDISTPATPAEIGSLNTANGSGFYPGFWSELDNGKLYGVSGFTSSGAKTLWVFDVTTPSAPSLAAQPTVQNLSSATVNRCFSVRGGDDMAFVAAKQNSSAPRNLTLFIYDCSTPASPAKVGELIYQTTANLLTNMKLDTLVVAPPVTHTFSLASSVDVQNVFNNALEASVNVGAQMEAEPLQASVDVRAGDGTVVVADVISPTLDAAR